MATHPKTSTNLKHYPAKSQTAALAKAAKRPLVTMGPNEQFTAMGLLFEHCKPTQDDPSLFYYEAGWSDDVVAHTVSKGRLNRTHIYNLRNRMDPPMRLPSGAQKSAYPRPTQGSVEALARRLTKLEYEHSLAVATINRLIVTNNRIAREWLPEQQNLQVTFATQHIPAGE